MAEQRYVYTTHATEARGRKMGNIESVINEYASEGWRLSETFERDGTTYVWIDLRRRPPGGTDAIDSVLVDEHGLVHEIRHEYAYLPPEASTVRTVVTVRTEPANVTASPPPWLDAG